MISGQERLACMDDAAGLRDALGVRLPESLPEIYLHRVSYPLRDLFLRYLRAHALVTAEQLAHEFSPVLPLSKSSFSNCVNRVW